MALLMDLKVVKVECVDTPSEEQSYLLPEASTPESNELVLRPTSQLSVCSGGRSVYHNDGLVEPGSEELELPEEGGTPDNWPQIPQLSRRRSCEANGERTNCINKAVEHLQLLLGILTDWVQKSEEKDSEDIDVDPKLSICDFDSEDKKGALIPFKTNLVPLRTVEALKYYNNHAQLKAVVKEVMLLLAWLHDDCQKTEAKLYSEKILQTQVASKIEEMHQKKVFEITDKVQKEHDIIKRKMYHSFKDLGELYRLRNEYHDQFKPMQKNNFKLKKDVAKSKESIPQVKRQILEINQQIDELENALNDAKDVLSETLERKAETESNYKELSETVKEDQHCLDLQLNARCHEVNVVSKAVKKAEKIYYSMNEAIVDSEEQIEKNEREEVILNVKLENVKNISKTEMMIHEVKDDLVEQVEENETLRQTIKEEEVEIQRKKIELIAKSEEEDIVQERLEPELTLLTQNSKDVVNSIESTQTKTLESVRQKSFYEENLKQLNKDIVRTESEVTTVTDELEQMKSEKTEFREKVDQKLLQMTEQETLLENTVKEIKKRIDIENNTYLKLADKVTNLEFEVRCIQSEHEEKKIKYKSKEVESRAVLKKMAMKLKAVITLHKEKQETLAKIEEEKIRLKEKYKKTVQEKEEYLVNFGPLQQKKFEKGSEIASKLVERQDQMENFKTKVKWMIEHGRAVEESTITAKEEITILKNVLEEFKTPVRNAEKHFANTEDRREQVRERLHTEQNDHNDLMYNRNETLKQILMEKQQSLQENERLALEYRITQNTLMQKKEQYVLLSDDTIMLKQACKDFLQVLKLQVNLQYYQQKYYNFRGPHMSKQLAYFLYTCDIDYSKVMLLRSEFTSRAKKVIKNIKEIVSTIHPKRQRFLPSITKPNYR